MPSHRANAHGTACEYVLAEKYNVDLDRANWRDGVRDGTPWEFKATAHRHADDTPGNFKIYREYHERLVEEGGRYGFAVYRIRGTGTEVLKTTTRAASRLPTVRWHGGGEHRGTEQAKLAIEDVF
ncbi:hypothetical protein GCM10009037_16930 [Halarchaeum grantii]|uniref:Uncharacterized protein n=1 Tax=Halarchaeum grantii TaxID=1193105 RepID=A0A830F9W6_9EURY|nr:hypothetical protein [Halarchaeum grantii]GGL33931.1 hypothetical protein GCM10009037_16930 [Halarchaeum grantii]